MEKKIYKQPKSKVHIVKPSAILAGSPNLGVSNDGTTSQEARDGSGNDWDNWGY